ncbi:Uncharacterised protein [Bordetella pertussis]|nr:Uncharacterised protein [Bordetella pertussis]
MPPPLWMASPETECDQPGSAGLQVASTRVSQAASAANRIQRASLRSAEMRA